MASNAPYYQLHASQSQSHPFVGTATQTSKYTHPEDANYNTETVIEGYTETQDTFEQENNQLAELLEAANEAAGLGNGVPAPAPELRRQQSVKRKRSAMLPQGDEDTAGRDGPSGLIARLGRSISKRVRKGTASPALAQDPALGTLTSQLRGPVESIIPSTSKAHSSITTYPPFQSRGPSHDREPTPSLPSPGLLPSRLPSTEAESAPLHPATALFRRAPVNPPKKYTRPPMSKLFVSLQLAPENFLQLQAQAKAYMLDPEHPERQACVGNRGKGDTDLVKLRLFGCVKDFLVDGAGERFFGVGAEGREVGGASHNGNENAEEETKWIWPRDGNTIVGLVMPLLRRMVTNERQRIYAIETRKGGKKEGVGGLVGVDYEQHAPHLDPSLPPPASPQSISFSPRPQITQHIPLPPSTKELSQSEDLHIISVHFSSPDSKPLKPGLDLTPPTIDTWGLRYSELCGIIERAFTELGITNRARSIERHEHSILNSENAPLQNEETIPDPGLLRGLARAAAGLETDADADADVDVNVEGGGVRLDGAHAPPRSPSKTAVDRGLNTSVEVLLPAGLSPVHNEEEWERAKREVARTFWFQGRCTVVVTVGAVAGLY